MSLFGRQVEPPSPISPVPVVEPGAYGITDLIRLLKTIPTDHQPQLVLQVIRTTLESVGVQSAVVIEDALVRENAIRDQMKALENQIVDLGQEIALRQNRIAELKLELVETIDARERLANTERASEAAPPPVIAEIDSADFDEPRGDGKGATTSPSAPPPKLGSLPPPVPPPRRKQEVARSD